MSFGNAFALPALRTNGAGASLNLDFVNGSSLPSSVTFSRGTVANQYNSAGSLIYAPMNSIRNNTMVGAVAGTPGTLPTNWGNDLVGVTRTVVGTGTANGVSYVDLRLAGTPTLTTDLGIYPEATNGIAATNGQSWVLSAWASIVGGSLTNIGSARLRVDMYDSTPAFLSPTLVATSISLTSSFTRFSGAVTTSSASTAYVRPGIGLGVTSGQAIDITLRIGMPQMELGSVATTVNATSGTAYYGPRFDYDPASYVYQNLLTYSEQFDNAAWTKQFGSLTATNVTAPDGTNTADVFTPTAQYGNVRQSSSPSITSGSITVSVWLRVASATRDIFIRASSMALLYATSVTVTSTWTRFSATFTYDGTNAMGEVTIQDRSAAGFVPIEIWGAQLNIGSTALPYYATTSAAYTQCAPQGLLIEEARTNSIRNNTMQGAVAGTPGTAPTAWFISAGSTGLSSSVVGTGSEGGINYIDVRLNGTPTATGGCTIGFEAGNGIAAATGQTWAGSLYLKLAAGSFSTSPVSSINQNIVENTAAGAFVAGASYALTTPTGASISTQRQSAVRTLSGGATVGAVQSSLVVNVTISLAVDITLRIGLPQLELGAFATSVMPTYGAAVTRNSDIATINTLTPWFNAVEGSLYTETLKTSVITPAAIYPAPATFKSDPNNRMGPYATLITGNNQYRLNVTTAGAGVAELGGASTNVAPNVVAKQVYAYKASDFALSVNNSNTITSASGAVPTVTSLDVGNTTGNSNFFNGYIRSLKYYPTRLSNASLQSLTA